ncbi:MAG: DUF3617 family protein [Alphaproteobacteria bacterium]|nr:DUF3617 family protein [Alphaproteobacteria bacterium]MBV9554109.1 DUF3617 family protein [Alphaproteobacteria bacterium]
MATKHAGAAGLMLAAAVAGAGRAEDAIRAGKWEFSAQVQVPNLPKLPPGLTLPPGVNLGPGGINVTRTSCVTTAMPVPADMRPPNQQHGQCKIGRLDKHGGAVQWESTCSQPDGAVVQLDGAAHYSGDKMEATFKTRISGGGNPTSETSQHISGRYLGPCDAK